MKCSNKYWRTINIKIIVTSIGSQCCHPKWVSIFALSGMVYGIKEENKDNAQGTSGQRWSGCNSIAKYDRSMTPLGGSSRLSDGLMPWVLPTCHNDISVWLRNCRLLYFPHTHVMTPHRSSQFVPHTVVYFNWARNWINIQWSLLDRFLWFRLSVEATKRRN